MALAVGCKSDCHRLCEQQVRCSAAAASEGADLDPERRVHLCSTVCEAMHDDPGRAAEMDRVLQCADHDCKTLASCVQGVAR